jgi:hypothetical protein
MALGQRPWWLPRRLLASYGTKTPSTATDLVPLDTDKFVSRFEKTPGRRVENKAKANEDSSGALAMERQPCLASRAEFSRDIQ